MNDRPLISVINVTYNGLDLLKETLFLLCRSLSETPLKTELIIIDNGSTDGTSKFIKNEINYPVKYVRTKVLQKDAMPGLKKVTEIICFLLTTTLKSQVTFYLL